MRLRECADAPKGNRELPSTAKNVYHALQKMARDLFRAMSLAPRQKCPRNVVEMKEAMAAFLAVTALQFLATVRDQKLFWSKF